MVTTSRLVHPLLTSPHLSLSFTPTSESFFFFFAPLCPPSLSLSLSLSLCHLLCVCQQIYTGSHGKVKKIANPVNFSLRKKTWKERHRLPPLKYKVWFFFIQSNTPLSLSLSLSLPPHPQIKWLKLWILHQWTWWRRRSLDCYLFCFNIFCRCFFFYFSQIQSLLYVCVAKF